MTIDSIFVSGSEFAEFAAKQLHIWSRLEGSVADHIEFGSGTIVKVKQREGYIPLIFLQFSSVADAITFNPDSFKSGNVSALQIPQDLEILFSEWKQRWEAEKKRAAAEDAATEAATNEFKELADKYNVSVNRIVNKAGITPLAPILIKLDNKEILDESELEWLNSSSIFNLLATYYYQRFKRDGDAWNLVKASSNLRKADMPNKVVEITSSFLNRPVVDSKAVAAILTSRGGAFRDLSEISQAKKCATDAIRLSPNSFHPHNLLGAVHYEDGDPVEGDKHFAQAIHLGASPRDHEAEIRTALARSGIKVRNAIADYLLQKDPKKYAWAAQFRMPATGLGR